VHVKLVGGKRKGRIRCVVSSDGSRGSGFGADPIQKERKNERGKTYKPGLFFLTYLVYTTAAIKA
jgi:hypothetical protein